MSARMIPRVECDRCADRVIALALRTVDELRAHLASKGWRTSAAFGASGQRIVRDLCARCVEETTQRQGQR